MSAKEAQTMRRLIDSIMNADRGKTSGYDTTATVRRVEDGVAWVHIPGGVDETPVKLTIAAAPGDTVQVRVAGGRAFLVGNATAPPTDDTTARAAVKQIGAVSKVVKTVQRIAEQAAKIAGNTNQYFWHTESGTDTGAHITEIPQEEFLKDPENGGGNLLARSNGIAIRDGLDELASFSQNGLTVEIPDGHLTTASGVVISQNGSEKGRIWGSSSYGDWMVMEGTKSAVLYGLQSADIFAPRVGIANYAPASIGIDPEDCDVEISGKLTVSGKIKQGGHDVPGCISYSWSNITCTANNRGTISNLSADVPDGATVLGVIVKQTPNNHWIRAYASSDSRNVIQINYVNEYSGDITGSFGVLIFFTL